MANSSKLKQIFKTIKINHRASIPFTRLQMKSIKTNSQNCQKSKNMSCPRLTNVKVRESSKFFKNFANLKLETYPR